MALHSRAKRGIVAALGHTPAATAPLATALVAPAPLAYRAAPLAYAAPAVAAPLAYSAPLAYAAPAVAAPLAYSAPVAAPILSREATLTTVVNNPGHAVSYRVD